MNKKLFFAGFALLAAVSFTSCNSDNPIDITNPNGVSPSDGSHAIGGAYDWTVTPKNVKQLDSLWNVDKKTVQANIANEKIASICINVENFTLENAKSIDIPELWSTGTKANGKIVKVYVSGNFKNPDYLRADEIKNAAAGKQTKFPVLIDTKNVAGSEVQFTFDAEKFDLVLTTDKARSIINGIYEIGYFKAIAATGMSATEVQSGLVDAIDVASSGDIKEKEDGVIAGAWTDGTDIAQVDGGKGVPVGAYIYAKDVYVQNSCTITNLAYDTNASKTFKFGTIQIVNPGLVNVTFAKAIYADEIVGAKAANNIVRQGGVASIDLNLVDNVENVSFAQDATLKKDVFSGVIFDGTVTFNTKDIASFDDVTFENGLNIQIHADDVTVNFDKVNFDPVGVTPKLSSTLEYTYTEAGYTSKTYQWIVSDAASNLGYYQQCNNDLSDLKEYNKGKESKTYTTDDVKYDGTKQTFVKGDKNNKSDEAKTYAVVVIKTPYNAGTYKITPEGTLVNMTSTCKFYGKTDDNSLNKIWGNVAFKDEGAWYSVKYADTLYKWRKLDGKTDYVLVK